MNHALLKTPWSAIIFVLFIGALQLPACSPKSRGSSATTPGGGNTGTTEPGGDGDGDGDGDGGQGAPSGGRGGGSSIGTGGTPDLPQQADGWSDFKALLVKSDGSLSLGTPGNTSITGRDSGSKIVYFDPEAGDNVSGEAYFWDGENIIDLRGSTSDEKGETYGSDPFQPNLAAIKPMRDLSETSPGGEADPRVQLTKFDFGQMAWGHPDWFLFRRGATHSKFNLRFEGGRNPEEPMLVGAYGPLEEGRAIIAPDESEDRKHPLQIGPRNGHSPIYCHLVLTGLDVVDGFSAAGLTDPEAVNPEGDPSSAFIEDCAFTKGTEAYPIRVLYPPRSTTIRRSAIGFAWNADTHNQGYYTAGPVARTTFDEVVFYRNGFKTDPRRNADPVRDQFSRNIYEGGGDKMGHTFRGIISADGASGGPQMRFGGLMENSLIVEGYWFSSTDSNNTQNPWTSLQEGQSAVVRNNVQMVLDYPSPGDPDPDGSSEIAQPGGGYTIQGSSFGAVIEGNIISGAMQLEDLGASEPQAAGLSITPSVNTYPDGMDYTLKNVGFSNNIVYHMSQGFSTSENWSGVTGVTITNNVFATKSAGRSGGAGLTSADQLLVSDNKFYVDQALPAEVWVGTGNLIESYADAAAGEGWSDPDRTLRKYVEEELNLQLLDWADDPYLDPAQASERAANQEEYDPTGLKTFMAVAMSMRHGGSTAIPAEGKPTIDADYPWDPRFTGTAVVNWIREGFNLPPVE